MDTDDAELLPPGDLLKSSLVRVLEAVGTGSVDTVLCMSKCGAPSILLLELLFESKLVRSLSEPLLLSWIALSADKFSVRSLIVSRWRLGMRRPSFIVTISAIVVLEGGRTWKDEADMREVSVWLKGLNVVSENSSWSERGKS